MKKINRKNVLKILIIIFIVSLVVIAIKQLVPWSKAEQKIQQIEVTYKPGNGQGNEITTTQQIYAEQTQGTNDYVNNKIILYQNGTTTSDDQELNFDGGTTEYEGKRYEEVLTGWKLTSVTQNGTVITENVKPSNLDYANSTDVAKDIKSVYAQNGFYIVPEGVTSIEVTAVYSRAIYIDTSITETTEERFGTSQEDAVTTLKRAYELIPESTTLTMYDTVFILCGDIEVTDYNSINSSQYKPVTITSLSGEKNSLSFSSTEDFVNTSSIRLDNIILNNTPNLSFSNRTIFEVTENTEQTAENTKILFSNLSECKINGGRWTIAHATETTTTSLTKGNLIEIGGLAQIDEIVLNGLTNTNATENYITNVPTLVITGGNIESVRGTSNVSGGNAKGNINIFVEDGKISNIYGTSLGNIQESETESGDINITIHGGEIGTVLGAENLKNVSGEVKINFQNFKLNSEDAKYKKIGNIKNAETLNFENSYVIIEETEETNLSGIVNINLPTGTGLKISTLASISGNFYGGGELYLESGNSLDISGNMTGTTILIINPKQTDKGYTIQGGKENPYIKARKVDKSLTEVNSGNAKYQITSESLEDGSINYYVSKDVEITDSVKIGVSSIQDKFYTEKIENTETVHILNNASFSSKVKLDYELFATEESKYTNLTRDIVLKKDKNTTINIPEGTEIIMVKDNIYYTYIAEQDIEKIPLNNFKRIDNNETFKEVNNIRTAEGVQKEINETNDTVTYNYSEEYRIVINFSNVKTPIENGTYYLMINVNDNSNWINQEQIETFNTVQIHNRLVTSNINSDKEKYEPNEIINLVGTIQIGAVSKDNTDTSGSSVQEQLDKSVYARIKLEKVDNTTGTTTAVAISDGTAITLNGQTTNEIISGIAEIKLLDSLPNSEIVEDIDLSLDMQKVLKQNQLNTGTYNIVLELVPAIDTILESKILGIVKTTTNIIDYENNYGISVNLVEVENLATDKLQIIKQGEATERTMNLQYSGLLEEPIVKLTVLEKTGEFQYVETSDCSEIILTINDNETKEITGLQSTQNIKVHFNENLKEGTYRILFELFDKYGNKKSENLINFIVKK